jgi:hypothetical protein
MEHYDPETAPDPAAWLGLDEGERIQVVENYHRDARVKLPKAARLPHATFHVIVENQLASNDEPAVRALSRLIKEGLSRHDAVHAIASIVAEEIYERSNEKDSPEIANIRYYASVERLTAKSWRDGASG